MGGCSRRIKVDNIEIHGETLEHRMGSLLFGDVKQVSKWVEFNLQIKLEFKTVLFDTKQQYGRCLPYKCMKIIIN